MKKWRLTKVLSVHETVDDPVGLHNYTLILTVNIQHVSQTRHHVRSAILTEGRRTVLIDIN